jgi:hypothetical protein
VLAKHHLIPSSDHQNPPHILPHHGAVDSSAPDRAGKREGGLEVSKTPRRNAPGRSRAEREGDRHPHLVGGSWPSSLSGCDR